MMNSLDIEYQNTEIPEAITQYEDHVTRDHDNMIMLREQNALMAFQAVVVGTGGEY